MNVFAGLSGGGCLSSLIIRQSHMCDNKPQRKRLQKMKKNNYYPLKILPYTILHAIMLR